MSEIFHARKIAILGAGLIGGSLASACDRHARLRCDRIAIYDVRPRETEAFHQAGQAGQAGETTSRRVYVSPSPAEAVEGAALVLLCVPIGRMRGLVEEMLPSLSPDAVVTDVGSVKGCVVAEIEPLFAGKARWIGGHPMAGREKAGFNREQAISFEGATVILTPTPATDAEALRFVTLFWETLGCYIQTMSPGDHDRYVAQISHLPHLVAAALTQSVSEESLKISGPGFRDTTRIAGGPAEMWKEILLANRREVSKALDHFAIEIDKARRALAEGRETELHDLLRRANEKRSLLEEILKKAAVEKPL